MAGTLTSVGGRVSAYVDARVASWRTGSRGSQAYVFGVLTIGVVTSFFVAWTIPATPFSIWFVWLILGVLVLRFPPLVLLNALILVAAARSTAHEGAPLSAQLTAMATLVLAEALILYQSRTQRSGLPFALSEQVLANLRDRLQSQAAIPDLPAGWSSHSSMLSAHGARYAGDFLVADMSDGRHLELVLVDVSGKGLAVGPQALQFAGAMAGLVGGMAPQELMRAANAFLLRQNSEEAFATAVHLLVDVETGHYVVTSAGHPPALRWDRKQGVWTLDGATGMALGVTPDADFESSTGQLAPGEALLFYTDGVVEARGRDLEDGINWLLETAREAVQIGFEGAAGRILRHVPRGQDDRAVLIIERVGPVIEDPAAAARGRRPFGSWTLPRPRRLRLGQPLE
ncbi:PP2C family protein-serine/threonine phosphatase [Nocardioides sp.]|uniref:PP2C family protein-serine/threonine phosphatase n=1 Tax=Nocardioides sp. TaxID=35761 RepID=UPI002C3D38FD|nr:PP2C family protein-serine/threonine phosphatase [Nocardioides sp.]HXH78636.1 PP2C family protein-serine/threonine phosphatase [Nocardioides sp.]